MFAWFRVGKETCDLCLIEGHFRYDGFMGSITRRSWSESTPEPTFLPGWAHIRANLIRNRIYMYLPTVDPVRMCIDLCSDMSLKNILLIKKTFYCIFLLLYVFWHRNKLGTQSFQVISMEVTYTAQPTRIYLNEYSMYVWFKWEIRKHTIIWYKSQ